MSAKFPRGGEGMTIWPTVYIVNRIIVEKKKKNQKTSIKSIVEKKSGRIAKIPRPKINQNCTFQKFLRQTDKSFVSFCHFITNLQSFHQTGKIDETDHMVHV